MAEKEDVMGKMRSTDPEAYRAIKLLEERMREAGCPPGVTVTFTEEMTEEEKEMALFEGFLKEGYNLEEAERRAREWMAMTKDIFDRDRKKGGCDI